MKCHPTSIRFPVQKWTDRSRRFRNIQHPWKRWSSAITAAKSSGRIRKSGIWSAQLPKIHSGNFFCAYTPEIRKGAKELSVGAGVYLNFCRGSIHATCVQMLTVANDVRYRISGAMQAHGIGSQGISQACTTRLISRTMKLQLRWWRSRFSFPSSTSRRKTCVYFVHHDTFQNKLVSSTILGIRWH
jgi:hypothetical protein